MSLHAVLYANCPLKYMYGTVFLFNNLNCASANLNRRFKSLKNVRHTCRCPLYTFVYKKVKPAFSRLKL